MSRPRVRDRGGVPVGDRSRRALHVCMLPDYSEGNPYQRKLAEALERLGVRVTLAKRLADMPLPAGPGEPGGPHVLHLHWTHGFMLDRRAWMTVVKGSRLLAWLARARRRGLRLVWTVHNLQDHERRHPWLELFFHRRLVRMCDALIVHCRYAREAVCEAYRVPPRLRERVYVIPHGHYLDSYENRLSREEARARLGLAPDDVVFLYLGLIRRYKGVPRLVRAFRSLDDPRARLIIAGRPVTADLRAEIEAAMAGDSRIRAVLEHVPDDDIQLYMNAADVVVMPYEEIFTSGTMVLAMSFGRAVVAPRQGCLAEVVEEQGDERGGILYDPAAPGGLEEALRRALAAGTAGLAAMGRHNRQRAGQWDWDIIARMTRDAYAG